MLTQEKLKELLDYNAETGDFTWKVRGQGRRLDSTAGSLHKTTGYQRIRAGGKIFLAHRLAWLYIHGSFPVNVIDHLNGDRTDNRISNLRDVSQRQNQQNTYKHRKGRLVGTYYHKALQKWKATIHVAGKQKYLGLFATELEGHQAYLTALSAVAAALDTAKPLTGRTAPTSPSFIVPHSVFGLNLTSTELIVLVYLISHNLSQFSPTVDTIAESTNLGRASVCRSLKTLQERKLLVVAKKRTSYGLRLNKYSLTLEN